MSKIKMQGIGYLGGDPEIIKFDNGDKIANVSIGVTESWKNKEGEKQSKTEWADLVFSGGLVNVVETYLKKGARIYFEGKQHTDKWTTKEGESRQKIKVRVLEMEMLGDGSQVTEKKVMEKNAPVPDSADLHEEEEEDSDLPF